MLQINNLQGKSDWINETQLIMVENEEMSEKEIDGISKHTITLNSVEGSDQTLLANANGQTFVIGLDHGLFENYSKSDLLLMSNSDLKILPNVTDAKLNYSLPSIDQSKSEIGWENNTFEKPLTKDILNVIQETSKSWQEIGKNGEICLDDIHSVEVHDSSKLNADFLIEPHMIQPKKLRADNNDEYIVGYYPIVETCDTVLVPASLMSLQQKTIGNSEQLEKSIVIEKNVINNNRTQTQLFENVNNNIVEDQSNKWLKSDSGNNFTDGKVSEDRMPSLKINNTQQNSLILSENINNLSETVIPIINSASNDFNETKSENVINFNGEKCIGNDDVIRVESENSTLPEQSLPLKKKAKMKKSPVTGNCNFLTGEAVKCYKNVQNVNVEEDGEDLKKKIGSDSEGLINRSKRKTDENLKKRKNIREENNSKNGNWKTTRMENINQNEIRYKNVTELLEQLRNEKFINETIFRILYTGLKEMDVDVLQEMYNKRDDVSPEYSSHLKAFALMIHFKQPIAFNRLREMFQNGWPSLPIIKDWKRRLNNSRRPMMKQ